MTDPTRHAGVAATRQLPPVAGSVSVQERAERPPTRRPGELTRRPVEESDRKLLLRIYASTRAEELAQVDWDEEIKAAFLEMQFAAQDLYYREHYPGATFELLLVDGEPAGRLYVDRWPREIRLMEIALLPEFRGRGIGSALLAELFAEAAESCKSVTIHVERLNRALHLYERLGFRPIGENGIYLLMEWRPQGGLS